jgi:hypothetical protein|mmetsp:Transcript_95902/g.150915  ORF Transcript_95902/g.150915 Transcript_95902/m.150915 type:complete len:274 (-) Transcript_95902:111-932(-)
MWGGLCLTILISFSAFLQGLSVDVVKISGECSDSSNVEKCESFGQDDTAIMIQARVAMPHDRSDWWLTPLERSGQGAQSGDEGSGLADLIEYELQHTDIEAQPPTRKDTDDSPRGSFSAVRNVLKLIKSEVMDSAINSSVAPAPFPASVPAQESSLINASNGAVTLPVNYSSNALAPLESSPAPAPYSLDVTKNHSSIMLSPVRNLTNAQLEARKQAQLDCLVDNWSDWGPCKTEGSGYHRPMTTRVRSIVQLSKGGHNCQSPLSESLPCDST